MTALRLLEVAPGGHRAAAGYAEDALSHTRLYHTPQRISAVHSLLHRVKIVLPETPARGSEDVIVIVRSKRSPYPESLAYNGL